MNGTEWQRKRGSRLGFLGATFVSVVGVGALVAIGLTIAASGGDKADDQPTKKQVARRQPRAFEAPAPDETAWAKKPAQAENGGMAAAPAAKAAGSGPPEQTVVEAEAAAPEAAPATAIAEVTKKETVIPEGPVTWEDGETAYREKRYADAAGIFERYTADRLPSAWGDYMLGLSRWKANDGEGAEEALRQAVALDSTHVKARINLARVLIDLDRAEEALGPIRAALELDPDNVGAWRVLGRTAHTLGVAEEAIDAYEEALSRNGDDAWSLNNLGLIYVESGRFEEALGPLARAVALEDAVAVFQNNLGMALERTGHTAMAAEAYSRATQLDESYEKAAVNLARVEPLADEASETPLDLAAVAEAWKPNAVDESDTEVAQTTTDPAE